MSLHLYDWQENGLSLGEGFVMLAVRHSVVMTSWLSVLWVHVCHLPQTGDWQDITAANKEKQRETVAYLGVASSLPG